MSTDLANMSDAEKAAAYDALQGNDDDTKKAALLDAILAARAKKQAEGPPRYKVIVSNSMAGDRVLFSSVSQRRARKFVEDRCPRGSHFFVRSPDGQDESYEHERHTGGPQGEDVEPWQPFDREGYQAPDLSPVNTSDPWADAWEGAQ